MASKLLNVLNEIEQGREACITALKNKGYPVDTAMSFEDLASVLYGIESEHFPHWIDTSISAYTEDTDPAFYHRGEDFPDIDNIFLNANDITYNGKEFKPEGIVSFNSTAISNHFYIDTATDTYTQLENNDIKVGVLKTTADKNGILIKTSDGATFLLDVNSQEYTHTWDFSKDIHTINYPNVRYIIIYKQVSGTTWNKDNGYNFTTVDVIECIFNHFNIQYNSSSPWNYPTNVLFHGNNTQLIKIISPHTNLGKTTYTNYQNSIQPYALSGYFECNTFIVNINTNYWSFPGHSLRLPESVIRYETNLAPSQDISLWSNSGYSNRWPHILEYLKMPIFFETARVNATPRLERLRYLYLTNTDPNEEPTICRFSNMPALVHTNCMNCFKTIDSNSGPFSDTFQNMRYLYFDNVETITGTGSLFRNSDTQSDFEVVAFPKLVVVGGFNLGDRCHIVKLMLPEATEINGLRLPEDLHCLYIPHVTAVNTTHSFTLPNAIYSVIASSLIECTNSSLFNKKDLHELVLPQGFKYSLELNYTGLTRTGLRNIIDNMGIGVPDDNLQITLGAHQIQSIGQEYVQKIADKGWTLITKN